MRPLLFLLFFLSAYASECIFTPPLGWEIGQLKNPSPHIKIGFIGKGSTDFRPSINLSVEEVDVPLKEYVTAVKELHLADPATKWRDLGKFSMQGGIGRLTEISNTSPWGELKILQAILVKSDSAYILTAAVLKEDLAKIQAELMKSFQSLNIVPDLWAPIADSDKRSFFTSGDKGWEEFQKVVKSLPEMGPYWQFLALQEGQKIQNGAQ